MRKSTSFQTYSAYLGELRSQVVVLRAFSLSRAQVASLIDWGSLDATTRGAFDAALKTPFEVPRLYPLLFIAFHAGFEQYLRDVMRESCDAITARKLSHDDLCAAFPSIKKWHVKMTGRAFGTVFEPIDYLPFDFDQLSVAVGTFVQPSTAVSINGDALSIREGNLSSNEITDFIGRLGLKLSWADVASDRELQQRLGKANKTAAGQALKEFFDQAVKTRNKVAHSQGAVVELSAAEIDDAISNFETGAQGMDRQITAFVDKAIEPLGKKAK